MAQRIEDLEIRVAALEALVIALSLQLMRGEGGFGALHEDPLQPEGTIKGPELVKLVGSDAFRQFSALRTALLRHG